MSNKIIVESFNDQAIYTHILNNFCKSSTDIEPIIDNLDWVDLAGLERRKFIIKLKDIYTDLPKALTTPKIGIIVDLDDSTISERIIFLNEICSEAFRMDINIQKEGELKLFKLPEQEADFELAYCFSGLNGQGELEHILKEIADTTSSHHANCLETGWVACLESKEIEVKPKELRKLWMDFYKRLDCLSKKEQRQAKENVRWDNFLRLHPDKFDFSQDIQELNQIKAFLQKFCT